LRDTTVDGGIAPWSTDETRMAVIMRLTDGDGRSPTSSR
jgi:hypothetical protein